ncbi:hypothetical protein LCGC14_3114060, partial [marine sediment metagenome]
MSRWSILTAVTAAVLAVSPSVGLCQARGEEIPFSDEAVERTITKAKEYLWSLHRSGRGKDPWPDSRMHKDYRGKIVPYVNYGGASALVMYSLLASGDKPTETRMDRAIKWLSRIDSKGTYTLGLRCQVWTFLPRDVHRRLLKKDASRLMKSIARPAGRRGKLSNLHGIYTYQSDGKPATRGDHSNTQFGILGVWAAARMNIEIPTGYWKLIYNHWKVNQNAEGAWRYGIGRGAGRHGHRSQDTMTAVGLASTFVAYDNLYNQKFVRCGAN